MSVQCRTVPAIVSNDAKDIRWSFRISESQLDAIKVRARKAGLSTGAYIIRCALGELDVDGPEIDRKFSNIEERLDVLERMADLGGLG